MPNKFLLRYAALGLPVLARQLSTNHTTATTPSSLRVIPAEYRVIPASLAEAVSPVQRVLNTTPLEAGDRFFHSDFGTITYPVNEKGALERKRITSTTEFLAHGDYCVVGFPGAETPKCTKGHLLDLLNNIFEIGGKYNGLVLVTKDTPDVNYSWVMATLKETDWYSEEKHNKADILFDLNIICVSDITGQLLNALGLLRDGKELGLTSKRCLMRIKDGNAAFVRIEHDDQAKWEHVSAQVALTEAFAKTLKPTAKL